MISRIEAENILKENLQSENLIKHSFAVAMVMESLAEKFSKNKEKWYITGLLHDVDYEQTVDSPEKHGMVSMDILKKYDLPEDVLYAIKSHSGMFERNTLLDKALWATDPITGLIIASALMNPEKKISAVKLKSLKKKYKSKKFAAGANREQIADCKEIGLELDEFMQISLEAMSSLEI